MKNRTFWGSIPGIGIGIVGSQEPIQESVSEPLNLQNRYRNRYRNRSISRTETGIGIGIVGSQEPILESVSEPFNLKNRYWNRNRYHSNSWSRNLMAFLDFFPDLQVKWLGLTLSFSQIREFLYFIIAAASVIYADIGSQKYQQQ